MRIHTDSNGVYVNAISKLASGIDVNGHYYTITAFDKTTELKFQQGGVANVGVNGITNEALLAVILHRMNYLQNQFPCVENNTAIMGIEVALEALESRTKGRIDRGVEGQEVA